jgi:hypothetical protein
MVPGSLLKEVKQQPGLLKYVSHRLLENPPIRTSWQRVEELWFENFDSWRKAVVVTPPHYTPPPWRKEEPFVDMVSAFVKDKPDVDFLRDKPLFLTFCSGSHILINNFIFTRESAKSLSSSSDKNITIIKSNRLPIFLTMLK